MIRLLAIVGPTASGKSELALSLSMLLNGEIVSADSRQIYKFLDIGTSKPSREDRKRVPHHFIDILEPTQDYNAGTFANEARERILEVAGRGKLPILVGGSGLYVKGVIDGFFEGPGQDPEIRTQLEERLKLEGPQSLLDGLFKVDPESAMVMDTTKPRRIIRALEVYRITGKRLSAFHNEQSSAAPFETVQFGFDWARHQLYQRVNIRADSMLNGGLLNETRKLLGRGYHPTLNALNTVGYKEVIAHLKGQLEYERMVELIKQNTRRFAKRQLTWFRRDERIRWIAMDEKTPIEHATETIMQEFRPS